MYHHKSLKTKEITEAVNILAHIAEARLDEGMWHGPEHAARNRERIRSAFTSILEYFQHLYERNRSAFSQDDVQRGIQAVMWLTIEAAQKLDQYAQEVGDKGESVVHLREYQALSQFYMARLAQRSLQHTSAGGWADEWQGLAAGAEGSLHKRNLTWDKVCRDEDTALFLMCQDSGLPFFNAQLLRHLHLVGAFDLCLTEITAEDLFKNLAEKQDIHYQEQARGMLHQIQHEMEVYFIQAFRYKTLNSVKWLNNAIMALMLAANPRHLLAEQSSKNCARYMADFYRFMREVARVRRDAIGCPPEFHKVWVNMATALVDELFARPERYKDLMFFWKRWLEEGQEAISLEVATRQPASLWHALEEEDALVRAAWGRHPSGPLIQAIELLTALQGKEIERVYDPFRQGLGPECIYTLKEVQFLRMPSPIYQSVVGKAEIAEEFKLFIESSACHLLVQLEDSADELSHARCQALSHYAQETEGKLAILSLPKEGDFYHQAGSYRSMEDAALFLEELALHFPSVPQEIARKIHHQFFGGKSLLTRKNRQDFIELFYYEAILQAIEQIKPDSVSFVSVNGIDTPSTTAVGLYAYRMHLRDAPPIERAQLTEWLYGPAIFLRYRPLAKGVFDRFCQAMILMETTRE